MSRTLNRLRGWWCNGAWFRYFPCIFWLDIFWEIRSYRGSGVNGQNAHTLHSAFRNYNSNNFLRLGKSVLGLDPVDTHTHVQRRIRHNHCIPCSPLTKMRACDTTIVQCCTVVSLGAARVRLDSIDRRQLRSAGGGAGARLEAAGGHAHFQGLVIEEKAAWGKRVGMKNDVRIIYWL